MNTGAGQQGGQIYEENFQKAMAQLELLKRLLQTVPLTTKHAKQTRALLRELPVWSKPEMKAKDRRQQNKRQRTDAAEDASNEAENETIRKLRRECHAATVGWRAEANKAVKLEQEVTELRRQRAITFPGYIPQPEKGPITRQKKLRTKAILLPQQIAVNAVEGDRLKAQLAYEAAQSNGQGNLIELEDTLQGLDVELSIERSKLEETLAKLQHTAMP